MFGSEILEIAVGLALIYLLLSLVVTATTEFALRLFALRANNLYKGIKVLLGERGFKSEKTQQFFDSAIIKSLTKPGNIWGVINRRPAYIASKRFYEGLLQTGNIAGITVESIESFINNNTNGDLQTNLKTFWDEASKDVEKFQANVEGWYNDSMDRVSGWFKRKAHTWTMIIAAVVTVSCNASTINIAEVLWNDDTRRAAVAKLAEDVIEDTGTTNSLEPQPTASATPADAKARQQSETRDAIAQGKRAAEIIAQSSVLPLGWEGENPFHRKKINEVTNEPIPGWHLEKWISQLFGWTITAFALTLGAPFWFDTLKRLINLRIAGPKPEQTAKSNPAV